MLTSSTPPKPRAIKLEGEDSPFPGALSIYHLLLELPRRGRTGKFAALSLREFPHTKCRYLPTTYDGEHIFEVPPIVDDDSISTGVSFDGHPWTKSNNYNSKRYDDADLRARKSFYAESFICTNEGCSHLTLHKNPNTHFLDGRCKSRPSLHTKDIDGDWRCSFCKCTLACVKQCDSVL